MFELLFAISNHIGFNNDYNSLHPHIRYHNESFIAGAYYNSEETISAYAGFEHEMFDNFSVELGLVTGYSGSEILPYTRMVYDFNNYKIFAAPALELYNEDTNVGVVIGMEIPLIRK